MTNEEIIRTIRTEAKRMANMYNYVEFFEADLLDFLDTLEKSEKPMQEGLDEEINRTYHDGSVTDTSDLDHNSYENIARHFAQWGVVHTPLPEDTVLFNKGVAEGKRLAEEEQADLFTIVALDAAQRAKEQMMKEAVEGKIIFLLNGDVAVNIGDTDEYKLGQKVRVIICKKEDEK